MENEVNPKGLQSKTGATIIGLTGGIACGKSLATTMFSREGFEVIDADIVARKVVSPGEPALGLIAKAFPQCINPDNQTLNRLNLNQLIFKDEKARKSLEAILHPYILRAIAAAISEIQQRKPKALILLCAPLLFETGLQDSCTKTILIDCLPTLQKARLMQRDGFNEKEALQRIHSQWPAEKKRALADFCIENNESPEVFAEKIKTLIARLRGQDCRE